MKSLTVLKFCFYKIVKGYDNCLTDTKVYNKVVCSQTSLKFFAKTKFREKDDAEDLSFNPLLQLSQSSVSVMGQIRNG